MEQCWKRGASETMYEFTHSIKKKQMKNKQNSQKIITNGEGRHRAVETKKNLAS